MKDFQPTPQGPEIRKVPPRPEMPGIMPPRPDKAPAEDAPEIDEEGDRTTIKIPETPKPEIEEDHVPDLDDEEDKKIKDIIKEIDKDKKKGPKPKRKGPTVH